MKVEKDLEKAKVLLSMAEITLERLNQTDVLKYPSNSLTDYYDIIHKLLESICFIDGIKIKGDGAHKNIIDNVSRKYKLSEQKRIFLQDMRDYRNRISYEGFMVNENYIKSNSGLINEIISDLTKIVKDKIN